MHRKSGADQRLAPGFAASSRSRGFCARLDQPRAAAVDAAQSKGSASHGFQDRDRRLAECGQIDSVQRADPHRRRPGGELSVLHHRAERGRGQRAGRPAGAAGGHREVEADHPDAHDLRRYRRAGAGRVEGRGARQPVPRQYPRMRRHRPCAALFRGRGRHACRRPGGPGRRCRDGRDRTDARRPRRRRAAPRRSRAQTEERRQGRRRPGAPAESRARGAGSGPPGAQPWDRRRGPARLADAAASDREARALCLQCRGSFRGDRQRAFRGGRAHGRRTGRGERGDLRRHRGGNRAARR